jgi:hypothetical protein
LVGSTGFVSPTGLVGGLVSTGFVGGVVSTGLVGGFVSTTGLVCGLVGGVVSTGLAGFVGCGVTVGCSPADVFGLAQPFAATNPAIRSNARSFLTGEPSFRVRRLQAARLLGSHGQTA